MHRVLSSLGAAVISIGLITNIALAAPESAGSGRAKNDDKPEGAGMVSALNRQVDRMASFTGLSANTVRALRTEQHLGWGVICLLNELDKKIAAKDLNGIVAEFKGGKGLGDIAKDHGIDRSDLGKCGKAVAATAKAKANAAAKGASSSDTRGGPPAHAKDKAPSSVGAGTPMPTPAAKGGPPPHAKDRISGAAMSGTPTPGARGGPPPHAKGKIPTVAQERAASGQ
jgi:hypothetical protein